MYQSSDARLIDVSKDAMRASLFDPASATFEGLRVVKHDQDRIVCGLVNAKNRLGGYVARRPFLSNGYAAVIYDDDDWRRYGAEMLTCDPTLEERRRGVRAAAGTAAAGPAEGAGRSRRRRRHGRSGSRHGSGCGN